MCRWFIDTPQSCRDLLLYERIRCPAVRTYKGVVRDSWRLQPRGFAESSGGSSQPVGFGERALRTTVIGSVAQAVKLNVAVAKQPGDIQ